jgi:hypothetical protein
MAETPSTDFEKQAREAVTAGLANAAGPSAVQVICQCIARAAQGGTDPRQGIVAAVKGSMGALLLAGKDLPDTAIKLLDALSTMSLFSRVGPEEVMSAVLEGIAGVTPMTNRQVRDALFSRIDEKYMGAGPVFDEFCEKAKKAAKA